MVKQRKNDNTKSHNSKRLIPFTHISNGAERTIISNIEAKKAIDLFFASSMKPENILSANFEREKLSVVNKSPNLLKVSKANCRVVFKRFCFVPMESFSVGKRFPPAWKMALIILLPISSPILLLIQKHGTSRKNVNPLSLTVAYTNLTTGSTLVDSWP